MDIAEIYPDSVIRILDFRKKGAQVGRDAFMEGYLSQETGLFSCKSHGWFIAQSRVVINIEQTSYLLWLYSEQSEETDLLGIEAYVTFRNPLELTQAVTATGTAATGSVSNNHLDYILVWNRVMVSFGVGGSFGISLSPLYFCDKYIPQTQTATITLQSLPEDARLLSASVPVLALEPNPSFPPRHGAWRVGLGCISP